MLEKSYRGKKKKEYCCVEYFFLDRRVYKAFCILQGPGG